MLKNFIISAGMLMAVFSCGKSETVQLPTQNEPVPGPGEVYLSLGMTGTQGIVIRELNKDYLQEIRVNYNGNTAPESDVAFSLTPWTEAELTAYNQEKGTAYQLLPGEVYELPASGTIEKGEKQVTLTLAVKADVLKELVENNKNDANYMLPLRLSSQAVEVQKLGSEVMYNVILSMQTLISQSGEQTNVYVENEETSLLLNTRLMEGNNFAECVAPFTYEYEVAENAAELVKDFNRKHGTGYAVMPESYYTMSSGQYAVGESSSSITITFHRSAMGDAVYVLPVRLKTSADAGVLCGNELNYIVAGKHVYTNPVIRLSVPDPTAIRASDGYYYLYGTEDLGWIPVFKSKDMVNWTREPKDCFQTQDSRPYWGDTPETSARSLWAPEIRYINGKYLLYYSWAIWGNHWNSEVGVAVSDSPTGPFTDHGQVIDAQEMNVANSIDEFEFEEDGKRYLYWGSFYGLYVTELTDDGLSVKRGADGKPVLREQVAGNAYEGTCVYKRGNYYYLFASIGSCCEGANSTYQTVVGRSESMFGPFVNKKGERMLDNKHEVIISGSGEFVGTGHNSIIQHDDAGQTWIICHGYVRAEADNGRYVILNQLLWDEDGWPYVEGGTPQTKGFAPIIDNR